MQTKKTLCVSSARFRKDKTPRCMNRGGNFVRPLRKAIRMPENERLLKGFDSQFSLLKIVYQILSGGDGFWFFGFCCTLLTGGDGFQL